MREQIEKKLGCTIEEFLRKEMDSSVPAYEAEYPNPFSIFTREESDFIETIIAQM